MGGTLFLSLLFPPSLWMHTHQGVGGSQCWACSSASFLLLWAFLFLINFTVTTTTSLFLDRVCAKLHMCFPLHAGGNVFPEEIHLRKDGMPASLLQGLEALGSDPGLLSNLKTEGVLARWPCGFAIGCSRAAYRGGVESQWERQGRLHWEGFWMAQGGRSGWVPVTPLLQNWMK